MITKSVASLVMFVRRLSPSLCFLCVLVLSAPGTAVATNQPSAHPASSTIDHTQPSGEAATPRLPVGPALDTAKQAPAPATPAPAIPVYPLDATKPRSATPAQTTDLTPILCRKLVAAATCKDVNTFALVRSGSGRFVFHGLYGARQQQFNCDVADDQAVITSKAMHRRTISAAIKRLQDRPCLSATLSGSLCDTQPRVEACANE